MGADILALQVRQVASRGGATLVSSSWKTYNDLMEERPDIVKTLCEANWPVHVYVFPDCAQRGCMNGPMAVTTAGHR